MKVTVLQENLARGLGIVLKAVSPRSTLPVLANVLVASDEGRLRLSATNLEMGITCWIPARIEEEGSTTVPSRTFSDLVSNQRYSQRKQEKQQLQCEQRREHIHHIGPCRTRLFFLLDFLTLSHSLH